MFQIIACLVYINALIFSGAAPEKATEASSLSIFNLPQFLSSIIYTALGLAFFALVFWLITKVVPFSMRKEIEEDQNIALGIIVGAVFLGIAIIIAAAIH